MESLEILNERLLNKFGKFNEQPKWRIVYSEDQYEKRLTNYTDQGVELLTPEVRELPKYKQWIHNKYILEHLLPVPALNRKELVTTTTYEPVWVFEDKLGNALPPKWEVCDFVIDCVHRQAAQSVGAKYRDPESTLEESLEDKEKRLNSLQEDMFGNETTVTDSLAHGTAIVVPHNYKDIVQ